MNTDASNRRPAIDVARILALAFVVFGHLAMVVVDRDATGALRGTNLFRLHPQWSFLAAAAPMPVFFAAAGWANATTPPRRAAARLRTLVGLAATVTLVWSLAVIVATLLRGDGPGVAGRGARLATQPLWFLAAYLPFAFWGESIARVARDRAIWVIGGCLVALAALDLVRFGLDGPTEPAWIGFFLAYGVPWVSGAWWRGLWTRGAADERRLGAAILAAAGIGAALLVAFAGYQASLIDFGSDGRSNTNPPTLYTAVIGLAQVGLVMLVASRLDALGRRATRWWDRAGAAAIAVYAWHLSALVLCVAVVAIPAIPAPRRLEAAWWWTRPLWIAAVVAVCAGLVAITAAVRTRLGRGERAAAAAGPMLARQAIGVIVAATGGAVIGRFGPSTAWRAALCSSLLLTGWLLLAERPRHA